MIFQNIGNNEILKASKRKTTGQISMVLDKDAFRFPNALRAVSLPFLGKIIFT